MKLFIPSLVAVSVAAVTMVAIAQTQTRADTTPSSSAQPAAVAVTPQTAAEANSKAVKRADVATVVRTSPSAADRAREMSTTGDGTAPGTDNGGMSTLPARADRN